MFDVQAGWCCWFAVQIHQKSTVSKFLFVQTIILTWINQNHFRIVNVIKIFCCCYQHFNTWSYMFQKYCICILRKTIKPICEGHAVTASYRRILFLALSPTTSKKWTCNYRHIFFLGLPPMTENVFWLCHPTMSFRDHEFYQETHEQTNKKCNSQKKFDLIVNINFSWNKFFNMTCNFCDFFSLIIIMMMMMIMMTILSRKRSNSFCAFEGISKLSEFEKKFSRR